MQELIDRYCRFDRTGADGVRYQTTTAVALVENGLLHKIPAAIAPFVRTGPLAIVCDAVTRAIAADALDALLQQAGFETVLFELAPSPGEELPNCDDATIDRVTALLATADFGFAIAVGAGTINDLVKMAAHRRSIPYACVATAPSMNGFTSSIAAILSDGVKTTQPCTPPIAVFADPVILAAAPYRMIASGIGDLYSKPVSNADWRLAHRLLDQPHSSIVMEIVEAGSALLDGVAERLPARDLDAVAKLAGALMMSGLAMQAAGNSGPASGGEHLISHYIDMTSVAFGESHDFHGCQVAVGTIVTSRLYEYLAAQDPASLNIEARVAALPSWEEKSAAIDRDFGPLAPAVREHARKIHPTPEALRARLTRLRDNWDSIIADVSTTLRPSSELEAELISAQCPTRFPEIGVARERARRAVVLSRDIRARFTILHLAADLGLLEPFADLEMARAFG
jgi:glycerol-1-phosphate dehydrogenase [NAD(P)+]